jgi:hypothetical protein
MLQEKYNSPSDMRLDISLTKQLQRTLKRKSSSPLRPKSALINRLDPNFIIIVQLVVDQLVMSSIGTV